jgi:hypothetical protein
MNVTSQIRERPFQIGGDTKSSDNQEYRPGPNARLLHLHRRLAEMPIGEVRQECLRALRYELDLPRPGGRSRVIDRLRSWLALPPETARRVIEAFGQAKDGLLPLERIDLADMERDALFNGLTFGEARRLRELVPWLTMLEPLPAGEMPPPPRRPTWFATALALAGD